MYLCWAVDKDLSSHRSTTVVTISPYIAFLSRVVILLYVKLQSLGVLFVLMIKTQDRENNKGHQLQLSVWFLQ